ncbi:MAG: single-stranded-DNA-specific exonuclease RecJ [Oscillospiraceae bacterium]|nr:single-stranded-DNA-specific exonuclease RecJ [Oscillospiraceae bacterium]
MLKRWKIGTSDAAAAQKLKQQGGISQLCAEVLVARGITSLEQADRLLSGNDISDPFLMKGMQQAADRILQAVDNAEKICVFGDYDCDGVTATVMLTDWLNYAGADVIWYIPTRKEGYGMRPEAIRSLHQQGVSLIVTVDNGISALEEAKLIRELGMELVITDHHRPGDTLPEAVAIVDPFQPDDISPYKTICGAVVVLKLIAAMDGGDIDPAMEQFGDLAALATIADVMPLTDENRLIVQRGLQLLSNTERMGLISLMAVCGIADGAPITAQTAAFQMIPRINAAGRFASASTAAKLFLTDDPDEAQLLAAEIHSLNNERKRTEQEILAEIQDYIRENPSTLSQRVLVFAGENWHHGVIGIVAARLMDRYGKPCFLMSCEEDGYRGSARSFGAFSVFECLKYCEKHLLRYGGHPGAGGFTVSAEEKDAFAAAIQRYAREHNPVMPISTLTAERAIDLSMLTVENVQGVAILEPFGEGNPKPLFVLEQVQVTDVYALSSGTHTKVRIQKNRVQQDVLIFRFSPAETGIQPGMVLDFLISTEVREYQGRDTLSLQAVDWRISEKMQEQSIAAQTAYDTYIRQEALPSEAYYQRMCPHRNEMIAVYQMIKKEGCISITQLCQRMQNSGMNLCRARVIADIFSELGLLIYDAVDDQLAYTEALRKRDLNESEAYRKIWALASASAK